MLVCMHGVGRIGRDHTITYSSVVFRMIPFCTRHASCILHRESCNFSCDYKLRSGSVFDTRFLDLIMLPTSQNTQVNKHIYLSFSKMNGIPRSNNQIKI